MKNKYRLEQKDNLIFWIKSWSHGEYTEQQLREMSIDKLKEIYNNMYCERIRDINAVHCSASLTLWKNIQ